MASIKDTPLEMMYGQQDKSYQLGHSGSHGMKL